MDDVTGKDDQRQPWRPAKRQQHGRTVDGTQQWD
jgi:hypothetical protein